MRKATPDANHVARLQGLLVDAGDAAARMYLNLALAKEQEDLGDDARAFAHLTAGSWPAAKAADTEPSAMSPCSPRSSKPRPPGQ